MKVLGTKILIEEEKLKDREIDGIFIPAGRIDYQKPVTAKVIGVGSQVSPTDVSVGDTIYYIGLEGQEISEGEITYKVLDISNIIAVK